MASTKKSAAKKAAVKPIVKKVAVKAVASKAAAKPAVKKAAVKSVAKAEGINLDSNLFGINVTSYIDQWLEADNRVKSKDEYLALLSRSFAVWQGAPATIPTV